MVRPSPKSNGNPCLSGKLLQAFTPIELLVVIAVAGVVAALLLPALSRAKSAAKAANCVNNLRQLGLGLQLYVDEAGSYPTYFPAPGEPLMKALWYTRLRTHVVASVLEKPDEIPLDPVFLCTEGRLKFQVADFGPETKPMTNFSVNAVYGYNVTGTKDANDVNRRAAESGLGLGIHCRAEQVGFPSRMIAFGCRPKGLIFPRYLSPYEVGNLHDGSANISFCDGHVERMSQASLANQTENSRSRWNNDGLAHRETWK